ncbi:MAG: oxidoreductase [Sedimenticola sp.]|nr:MAG: oxidoreductase [Sedimenticola sp.]
MPPLRFGIVGCGGIANKGFAPALEKVSCASLGAACDVAPDRAEALTRRFGGVPVSDYEQILLRDDIDAVYIATPVGTHARIAMAALEHGKHVLCEKPLTATLDEARTLIAAFAKKDVALFEGFMYQYHTQHQAVRDLIDEGQVGTPFHFQAWFGFPPLPSDNFRYDPDLGGGALLDAGAYTIHAARRFFGAEPERVSAMLDHGSEKVDTRGAVQFDFGQGRTAHLVFGFNHFYRSRYSVWGTAGLVTLGRAFAVPATLMPPLRLEKQDHVEDRLLPPCDHFAAEIEVFCGGYESSGVRTQWLADALAQAEVIDQVKRVVEVG